MRNDKKSSFLCSASSAFKFLILYKFKSMKKININNLSMHCQYFLLILNTSYNL